MSQGILPSLRVFPVVRKSVSDEPINITEW
jgi:hypothetical protein